MKPTTRAELTFGARLGRPPQGVTFTPGRVVILGEHLDHQGGRVLAAPIEEGVAVAYAIRPDTHVAVWSMNAKEKDHFALGQEVKTGRTWSDLARGAFAHMASDGRRLPGLDLLVYGDLPIAAGLASSSAYLLSVLKAINGALGESPSARAYAEMVPVIEAAWSGVPAGPMDPYVLAVAEAGQILEIDCRTLEHEAHTLPDGTSIETESTGVTRRLENTPYQVRIETLERASKKIKAALPRVEGLCDLSADDLNVLDHGLDETELRRVRHVVSETARMREGSAALRAGDLATLGRLMRESHISLRDDYDASLPEIDQQVEMLWNAPGVLGARLQGAGWGGHVAVLREALSADENV